MNDFFKARGNRRYLGSGVFVPGAAPPLSVNFALNLAPRVNAETALLIDFYSLRNEIEKHIHKPDEIFIGTCSS